MSLTPTIVTDESGQPVYVNGAPLINYKHSGKDAPHFLLTGPDSSGHLQVDDTFYDVTAPCILVQSQKHAQKLAGHIDAQLRAKGRHPDQIAAQAQMALLSTTGQASALNAVAGISPFTNLHSASPGTTGANELASVRQATSWSTASSGTPSISNTGALSYTLAASTTASHIGGWSVVTAASGTFSLGFVMSPSVTTGASAGTVTVAVSGLSATGS